MSLCLSRRLTRNRLQHIRDGIEPLCGNEHVDVDIDRGRSLRSTPAHNEPPNADGSCASTNSARREHLAGTDDGSPCSPYRSKRLRESSSRARAAAECVPRGAGRRTCARRPRHRPIEPSRASGIVTGMVTRGAAADFGDDRGWKPLSHAQLTISRSGGRRGGRRSSGRTQRGRTGRIFSVSKDACARARACGPARGPWRTRKVTSVRATGRPGSTVTPGSRIVGPGPRGRRTP